MRLALAFLACLVVSCSGSVQTAGDAGPDGTLDAGQDAGRDAGADAVHDAGTDAGRDAGADAGADGDQDPVDLSWEVPTLAHRVRILVRPHAGRDRVDLPVLAPLSVGGGFLASGIALFEITGGQEPEPVPAHSWTQPDGSAPEVGFTAPGVTPAGATREFVLYLQITADPDDWTWDADGWATRRIEAGEVEIAGPGVRLVRELDAASGILRRGRLPAGATGLFDHASGWRIADGFSTGFQLQNDETFYPAQSAESYPVDAFHVDGDAAQAALSAAWALTEPVAHDLHLTYRVFSGWPFAEVVLSAGSDVPGLRFSGHDWNARHLYLTDTFDRMVSDNRGDEALEKIWDTSMRWLVPYDAASGHGAGWFLHHQGVVRAEHDGDGTGLYDSYGHSSGGSPNCRWLWMAHTDKDAVVDLFDAMQPGVDVTGQESRDLNILAPRDGAYVFAGDRLEVVVSTPGNPADVTATWTLPDGSELPEVLTRSADPLVWVSAAPVTLGASHPTGAWTLTAQSAGETRSVSIQVARSEHPRLLFSAGDLPGLRARKDGAHADIWAEMLDQADSYGEPIPDPGPGRDIRGYADRLINLALIQLVDPLAPYDDKLWSYFFSMLRYPNWEPGGVPFNNLDLTVGHFLTAIAFTYDWHHQTLTSGERAEVRALLRAVTGRWLDTGWMRAYPDIDFTKFGTVTNNHYWINHMGIAAAAYVLEDEMPEPERLIWLARLESNLATILSVLEHDGSSHEGVAYHTYGQINLFRWLDMRDRALGVDTTQGSPWFAESVLYDLYSIPPGGDDNYGGTANFGDCPPYHYQPPRTIEAWLAGRLGDGHAQWMAEQLQWPRITAMSYLWYDPSVPAEPPATLPVWRFFPDKGIFVWRSSWEDDAVYFSLKSGSYFGGHEQPDAGHFILHRAGVPYLVDLGYSYRKMTDEHNLILVDGAGQHGEDRQWMGSVDPVHWASTETPVAGEDYFDLLADPTSMFDAASLQSWHREVIGLQPGIFLVRDAIACSGPATLDWLLHAYRTDPPSSQNRTYDYRSRRLENPWLEDGPDRWRVSPQDTAPELFVHDLSGGGWSAVVEPTFYVPETKPDGSGYNEDFESFQQGFRLRRWVDAAAVSSIVAMWFDPGLSAEALGNATAEGARITRTGLEEAVIIWPFSGGTPDLAGYHVTGAMAGRRMDRPALFGRDLTRFAQGMQTLIQSSAPVSIFARTEHQPTPDDPLYALTRAEDEILLLLACSQPPTEVRVDDVPVFFTWDAGQLSVTVPPGTHRLDLL